MKSGYTVSREGLNYIPILELNVRVPLEAKKKEKRRKKKITNVPNQMFTLKSNGYLPIILLSLMKL